VRSQIAEALINKFKACTFEAYSAGTKPTKINPYAVKVMAEIGVDISRNQAKHTNVFQGKNFDYVVTVCDHAKEICPFFPGARKYLHQAFTDPSTFAGDDEEMLSGFRPISNEIKSWIESTFNWEN
jgi:arsenate reductase